MTRTNDSLTKKAVSVIDEPVLEDTLGIRAHSAALIEFVEDTDTPITIGIQGQWGSGKTSLIKTIRHHFSETRSEVKQISVNAWECSLQSTPEEALVKIVDKIIHEIFGTDRRIGLAKRVITSARDLFRWTLGFAIHFSLGSEAAEMTHKAFKTTEGIQKLREGLETTVKEMATRRTNPYIRVIIYVDDLDRIEPKNAVAILELLKNIFTVKGCVFILAIDYDVVVKGLEDKFGKPTPENDWEFRAFFDKIIQLPFLMPMNEYDIGEYVNTLLLEIDFVTEPLDEDDVTSIVRRTIGNNPRSIKRLINALSLARILTKNRKDSPDTFDAHDEESKEKLLLFSLFCLQIAKLHSI